MAHPHLLLLLSVVISLEMISMVETSTVEKRSVSSYAVQGCFSALPSKASAKNMGGHNSNVRCQEHCRDLGYILAATTKGKYCYCSNVYPKGQKTTENKCSSKCRSYSRCYSSQSCCGGPNAYSVSVVGNIDVAKQILRRLAHAWQTNKGYRDYMLRRIGVKRVEDIGSPRTFTANWYYSFDKRGWSTCREGTYMTGLWRNTCYGEGGRYDKISLIEYAECRQAPSRLYPTDNDVECYKDNWGLSFDRIGWSKCRNGYYMKGLYISNGNWLYNIEDARCCRPKSQVGGWGSCYDQGVWKSFDGKGWSKCASGYYMAGLWRNSCNKLFCLEQFKCCQMGRWADKPTLSINMKDTSGSLKRFSMNAMDTTPTSITYSINPLARKSNMLILKALSFKIEDKTQLNVAKPTPIKGFRPVTCSQHSQPYKCRKWVATTVSSIKSFTIGTGFTQSVMVGDSLEITAKIMDSGTTKALQNQMTKTTSLNKESSFSESFATTDNTDVSITVPSNTEIKINLMRTVEDLEYKWKATFQLLGKYSVKWGNNVPVYQDVTTTLTGSDRVMYAFGSWRYPGTDGIRVVITDKYGNGRGECRHALSKRGENKKCHLEA